MKTFLLLHNPNNWDITKDLEQISKRGFVDGSWSTGSRKRIKKGARVFMLRVGDGVENKGIIGSGYVTKGHFRGRHWRDDQAKRGILANYVEVRWEQLIDADEYPDRVLAIDKIPEYPGKVQGSGTILTPVAASEIERRWKTLSNNSSSPGKIKRTISSREEETPDINTYFEGDPKYVLLTIHERNRDARNKCVAHFGATCQVCKFDFGVTYGKIGKDFIHVHHHVMVSKMGERYKIDPVKHLIPVCPNCHAMLHTNPPKTITQLRQILQRQQTTKSR